MPDLAAAIRARLHAISAENDDDCTTQRGRSCADDGYADVMDAVLAVVELHRPEHVEYVSVDRDERTSTDCAECDAGGVPDGWPCTTLRSIAKALGIEATDG